MLEFSISSLVTFGKLYFPCFHSDFQISLHKLEKICNLITFKFLYLWLLPTLIIYYFMCASFSLSWLMIYLFYYFFSVNQILYLLVPMWFLSPLISAINAFFLLLSFWLFCSFKKKTSQMEANSQNFSHSYKFCYIVFSSSFSKYSIITLYILSDLKVV